ncbi:MAG: Rrf2 family transcriptional regulator [Flavobacteriales bacterium]|nr:Rrf2 family transcriptional regulator [Flavobacteriales bacterium]
MFSKACEYAIRATLYIAVQSEKGERCGIKEIAASIDSPEAFTAKILQTLSRNKIIESVKGPNGGFFIEPTQAKKIKLSEIVFAIDGDGVYKGCGLGLNDCNAKKPCPVHNQFKQIRDDLRKMLESTSVNELSHNIHKGGAVLKR